MFYVDTNFFYKMWMENAIASIKKEDAIGGDK